MSRPSPTWSPKVCALLARERVIPPLPDAARARALARARAALVADAAIPASLASPSRRTRWAAVAALICAVGAAAGAAAYAVRVRLAPAKSDRAAASIVAR